MPEQKIVENKVQCLSCNEILLSIDDEPVKCKCEKVSISGGYVKIVRGDLKEGIDYKELSKFYMCETIN